jgi:hypothetical protein
MEEDKISRRQAARIATAAAFTGVISAQKGTMAGSDICFMTATEMARRLRSKELSAVEVMTAHLQQIERVNPKVNAIVTLVADQAMKQARDTDAAAARGQWLGPLHGLPVAHKDLHDTKGIRTTYGSRTHRGRADRGTHQEGGRDHGRQDQHPRVRRWLADVQSSLRCDPQSVRSLENLRWQQRGSSGLTCLRHDPDR